jgi:hypothetical protein
MQGLSLQRSPSAGSVIKKIVEINPDLGVREIAELIRRGTSLRGVSSLEYQDVETIDEALVLELARKTLRSS